MTTDNINGDTAMTTVTAVKRALEETRDQYTEKVDRACIDVLANNSRFVTILANRLSDMGRAGNAARDRNLAQLRNLAKHGDMTIDDRETLAWAIDQLTPRQTHIAGMLIVEDHSMPPGTARIEPAPGSEHQGGHMGTDGDWHGPGVERVTGGMPVCTECGGWGEHTSKCSLNPFRIEPQMEG